MNDTYYAYCAGIIDSDGTIYIDRSKDKRRSNSLYNYSLRVKVGQSDDQTVKWLSKMLGGKYRFYKYQRNGIDVNKGLYYWAINNQKAALLLRNILPYLKIKKQQAKLAIKFAELLDKHIKGKPLLNKHRIAREDYALQMRFLNQRKVA